MCWISEHSSPPPIEAGESCPHSIETLAYLGSQVTTGINYIFLISSKAVVAGPTPVKLAVATVNSEDKSIRIEPIFDEEDLKSYKVLRSENVGKPLGEWP